MCFILPHTCTQVNAMLKMKLLQSHVSADNVFKTVSINIGISRYAEMNRDLLESYISHQVAGNE